MNKQQATDLLHEKIKNENLRRHCYAVSAVMGALAERLGQSEDKEKWEIAGLIHDVDYEEVKDTAATDHTKVAAKWLEELEAHAEIKDAVARHAWKFVEGAPEPKTQMDWALYTCDELTGFIVAVALVKPERKLSAVTLDSVTKKWKQKTFAAGVHREQIEMCDEMLGIPLEEFIEIAIVAMQTISTKLEL